MSLGGLSYGDVVEEGVQSLTLQASLEQSHHSLEASPLAVTPPIGILRVNGIPGEGQDSEYAIFACEGTLEVPKKRSCYYLTRKQLNKEVPLNKGIYHLIYSSTTQSIEVKEEALIDIDLDKITINPQGQKYSLYWDFTNKKMQDFMIRDFYINSSRAYMWCNLYGKYSPDAKTMCKYTKSKNLDEYAKIIRFNEDGSYEVPYFYRKITDGTFTFFWYSDGRKAVSHTYDVKKEENFVSVFRGTYIVQFTDDNGQTSDVYGVNSWED